MPSKKILQFTSDIDRIGQRFVSLAYLGKGSAVILASNVATQLAQSAWKYVVNGVIHILRSTHDGAANRAKVMLGLRESDEINEKQRHVLLSGLFVSRMSPNRAALLVGLMWKELSEGDKAIVLRLCFSAPADRKAHKGLFDAIATYAEHITEPGPDVVKAKSRSTSPTFSTLAFVGEDKEKGGKGKSTATVEDAVQSVESATQ